MTCDIEFLAEVNNALSGARFNALVFVETEGSLELLTDRHRYRIDWSGWLSGIPNPTFSDQVRGYEFAPIIGPMIGESLVTIRHNEGVYELIFSGGRSVFAGHFGEVNGTDHVLLITALDESAPFTWGLLD